MTHTGQWLALNHRNPCVWRVIFWKIGRFLSKNDITAIIMYFTRQPNESTVPHPDR